MQCAGLTTGQVEMWTVVGGVGWLVTQSYLCPPVVHSGSQHPAEAFGAARSCGALAVHGSTGLSMLWGE